MSANKLNELQEAKKQAYQKEKEVVSIKTGKNGKKNIPSPSKFLSTEKIDVKYVENLEKDNDKLRVHLKIISMKFSEIIQFINNQRQVLNETGFALQSKAREGMDLLNIKDKDYDLNWVISEIKKLESK